MHPDDHISPAREAAPMPAPASTPVHGVSAGSPKRVLKSRTIKFGAAVALVPSLVLAGVLAGQDTLLQMLDEAPAWIFLITQIVIGVVVCFLRTVTNSPVAWTEQFFYDDEVEP